jgi:hypothetical protein
MSRTLHYGTRTHSDPRAQLAGRIEKHVIRRHTSCGYDRMMGLAAQDYARHVALEVTPHLEGKPQVTFQPRSAIFGQRPAGSLAARRISFLNE